MATPVCPSCHGRGGMRGPNGWIKCSTCKPRQTNAQAREAALDRLEDASYRWLREGDRKLEAVSMAWSAARNAGAAVSACHGRLVGIMSVSNANHLTGYSEAAYTYGDHEQTTLPV